MIGSATFRALALAALALCLGAGPALAQSDNSCRFALNAECNEPDLGDGQCRAGTDSWDCRRAGTWTANQCFWAKDGECDEPGLGTDMCPGASDRADCDRVHGAGTDPLRAFYGSDDREFVDSTRTPWSAIGRIAFEGGGHCTGTVVGPKLVLTAAHCLFDSETHEPSEPLEFVAGQAGSAGVARAGITRVHIAPGFDNARHTDTDEIDGLDWAFLELDQDISAKTGTMSIAPALPAGDRLVLTQAGYSADSHLRLSAHRDCRLVTRFDDGTFFHECDTLQGDSGSPLFVREGGGFAVVGIESATYPNPSGRFDHNMAVDARGFHPTWIRLIGDKRKSRAPR